MQTPLWVYDNSSRKDRINYRPENVERSLAWFRRVSATWSRSARRGFIYHDAVMRCARTGHGLRAFVFWSTSVSAPGSAWDALRQLLRILGRGEVPGLLRELWRRYRRDCVTELEGL